MQQVSLENYEKILKYMQTTNQQNYQKACEIMSQNNYNLNTAINNTYRQPSYNRQPQENDNEIIQKFIKHIHKKNQQTSVLYSILSSTKNLTIGILKTTFQWIFPQFILKKTIRSSFYNTYFNHLDTHLPDQSLHKCLDNTMDKSYKACFLIISGPQPNQAICKLLNNSLLRKNINNHYYIIGFLHDAPELKDIERANEYPQILICRYDVYEKIVILDRYIGQDSIDKITRQTLSRTSQKSKSCYKKDRNVVIKYRNYMRRQYFGTNIYEQDQYDQIDQTQIHNRSSMIQQQNRQYERIEEQVKEQQKRERQTKLQQMQQKAQFERIQQERKLLLLEIPPQPTQGDIIRFNFRCPNGSMKIRSFEAHTRIKTIYLWVETNQDIIFENPKRLFELRYSYPPIPLAQHKDKQIKDVFESQQEKILICQL